jgi:hypothetical protein
MSFPLAKYLKVSHALRGSFEHGTKQFRIIDLFIQSSARGSFHEWLKAMKYAGASILRTATRRSHFSERFRQLANSTFENPIEERSRSERDGAGLNTQTCTVANWTLDRSGSGVNLACPVRILASVDFVQYYAEKTIPSQPRIHFFRVSF